MPIASASHSLAQGTALLEYQAWCAHGAGTGVVPQTAIIQSQSGGMVPPQSPPGTIYNFSPGPSPGEVVQIADTVCARCGYSPSDPSSVCRSPCPPISSSQLHTLSPRPSLLNLSPTHPLASAPHPLVYQGRHGGSISAPGTRQARPGHLAPAGDHLPCCTTSVHCCVVMRCARCTPTVFSHFRPCKQNPPLTDQSSIDAWQMVVDFRSLDAVTEQDTARPSLSGQNTLPLGGGWACGSEDKKTSLTQNRPQFPDPDKISFFLMWVPGWVGRGCLVPPNHPPPRAKGGGGAQLAMACTKRLGDCTGTNPKPTTTQNTTCKGQKVKYSQFLGAGTPPLLCMRFFVEAP